jgi:hypothetical protein
MQKELILKEFEDLKKVVALLGASANKFMPYDANKIYAPDELEYYDSLSFRFEKSVETILNFFRGLEIYLFSKSSDTLRDRLLTVQKLNLIDDIDFWMETRLLRNRIAHAYLPEQLKDIYDEIMNKSTAIFDCMAKIEKYFNDIGILNGRH